MLNLDEQEYLPLNEEDNKPCLLCNYFNKKLDILYYGLMNSVSKSNLYKILYETFTKDQTILKQQNMEYHTMSKEDLTHHFENHVVTIERAILHDVCIIKQLMQE